MIHMATIAVAVAGFLVYALWETRNFRTTGEAASAFAGFAGFAGALVTALYLRKLLRERARV